jgi:hypothetical protein
MRSQWFIRTLGILVVVGALAMPQSASAISLGGDDWTFSLSCTIHSVLGDIPVAPDDRPLTISQTSATNVGIPLALPEPINLTLNLTGTLSGTTISTSTSLPQTDVIVVPATSEYFAGSSIQLENVTALFSGVVDQVNGADTSGGFGGRGYHIAGTPAQSNVQAQHFWVNFGGSTTSHTEDSTGWSDWGAIAISNADWSAARTPVTTPEPGTIAMLLGIAVSLFGYRCWRRRGT